MSIVIFGDTFTFPEGGAATNRVYTYAKGFIENGINVHVICFENEYRDKSNGIVNGIKYYHPLQQTKRSENFIVRQFYKFLKYPNAFFLIKRIHKAEKIIAIISCSDLLLKHLFTYLLSRVTNAKFIVECSEHPLRFHQSSALQKKQGEIKLFIEAAISDGIFCISHFLIDFYKRKGVNSRKLFLVPSTVDPTGFVDKLGKPVDYKYVGYFGSLTFGRDNIDLLIKAFAAFSKNHDDIHLILGGFCSNEERKDIVKLIAELDIQSRVLLLPYLTRKEILQYVMHADILVMVRRNDLQSQASFPSKLTEFLASSKPVISVNVGEIPLYIKDGKDAFLVEPGNTNALAEKLDYLYRNPQIANRVGKNGKQLTETIFHYKYQADRIIGFIRSLE